MPRESPSCGWHLKAEPTFELLGTLGPIEAVVRAAMAGCLSCARYLAWWSAGATRRARVHSPSVFTDEAEGAGVTCLRSPSWQDAGLCVMVP